MTAAALTNAPAQGLDDIRGPKLPLEIPQADPWIWWILGAVAAIALLCWILYRMLRPSETPPRPPHLRARERLAEAEAIIAQPEPFCIAVSDTLRLYMEERFLLRAPEKTTEEFLEDLRTSQQLTAPQKQTLAEFLSLCDLAKFARYQPDAVELRQLHSTAKELVAQATETTHAI